MKPTTVEFVATLIFALAAIHTLSASFFNRLASKYRAGSMGENFFHLLGEVEVVFGIWAGLLIIFLLKLQGSESTIAHLESLHFTEAMFVFAIMVIASTKPIIFLADRLIHYVSILLPLQKNYAHFVSCLVVGPLVGSFITEPAAMTVTALILREHYFKEHVSTKFKYMVLATLFVNISIGGTLTHFAAPPVLMVAAKWQWGLEFMLENFGWKVIIATTLNALIALYFLSNEIKNLSKEAPSPQQLPWWLNLVHILFLFLVVLTAHHEVLFIGLFLFFMGFANVTKEYQAPLKIRQSLLVGYFLAGLVVLGSFQQWWLRPLLANLETFTLFVGATALTAFTDNAALTFLGSQVEGLSNDLKYALVAGAVAGGGLTVIANAPNPAGYSILQDRFGKSGIVAIKLFLYALPPTIIAMLCLWLL